MHIEVQVALNFVISYLYNKLPRRRVNIFGEELEKALKEKFQGHWYPEKPFKGSAFRCLKTGDPIDPVLERAAKESGVPIQDILENLPQELAVWVDPGEVSYRIGEKGQVKILFADKGDPQDETKADREVTNTFNPEAQCFRPIETVGCVLNGLNLSPKQPSYTNTSGAAGTNQATVVASSTTSNVQNMPSHLSPSDASSPTGFKGSTSPVPAFIPRATAPLTFTTATFAQTKFGSTKLKTSTKRANRMSPTEFSNYIKLRAIQQQLHQQPSTTTSPSIAVTQVHHPQGARALSPDPSTIYFTTHGSPVYPQHQFPGTHRLPAESSTNQPGQQQFISSGRYGKPSGTLEHGNGPLVPFYNGGVTNATGSLPSSNTPQNDAAGKLLDNGWSYSTSGHYHLLVAN